MLIKESKFWGPILRSIHSGKIGKIVCADLEQRPFYFGYQAMGRISKLVSII